MTSPRLDALRTAIAAIAETALANVAAPTCEDALDVIQSLESACRVAVLEHCGHGSSEPVWEPSPEDEAVRIAEEREWRDEWRDSLHYDAIPY